MFKHILAPISGDSAKITLVYVSDPIGPYMYADSTSSIVISEQEHQKACNAFAKKVFEKAKARIPAGVSIDTVHVFHPNIADGIIDTAKSVGADVICMVSHKRTGLKGLFLRSESQEVILHSHLPVLVLNA